jgi:hypothetical protein
MKYALDKMLPLRAFQGRGTPIGGRGLRLYGDGGYTSGDYDPNWLDNTFPEPAPSYQAPADAAPAPAPANQWQQTVNDIYQQEFGRAPDASGMESFSAALNSGMTGEQMRETLRLSAEGQSYGLSPDTGGGALPTALTPTEDWQYQPESYAEFTNAYSAPYYLDVNSGERQDVAPVQYSGINLVDPNTLAQHLAPNFEGTPTQFYDEQGNLKGVLVDAVRAGLNTREGELILDPMSLGLALKPNETASLDSKIQQRNAEGQLLFIDPLTGGTTIYNTGVPAETGSTVKDLLYMNERKYGGQIPADMTQGALLLAAAMATGGVGGALMNAAGFGAGAGAGLGAGAVAGGDIGAFLAADAAAGLGSAGINWSAAATAAAKTAAINAAVTAAQGGNVGDVLKAGALGAVTGGAGVAGAGLLGGGTLAQIGTQTAIATAIAAARGQDPLQAALSGAITATLSTVIPAGTSDVLNGAGITDPSIQKAINSAISSSVVAAVRGGDIGTAAIMGAVNSALTSVAGMIGNSQVVQDIKANITNALTSTIDSVKYEIGATNAQALPIEGSNRSPVGTELDAAPYDADAELDKVIQNLPSSASGVEYTPAAPPLVQNAINQNTPTTLANVVIPPLMQQATGQADADAIYNQLVANAANPTVGAPSTSLAGATTSDVNPVVVPSNDGLTVNMSGSNKIGDLLDSYNTGIATLGYAPVKIDDEDFLDYARKAIEEEGATSSAPESTTSAGALPVSSGTGDFLGAFEDLAPAKVYGSAVPQVDVGGNVIRYDQPAQDTSRTLPDFLMNLPTKIRDQALGIYEVGMNQLGFVVGNVAAAGYGAGQTWYNLATGEPVDPAKINEISNEIAKRLSYTPQTEAGQVLAQAIPEAINSAMGSGMGLPPVTNLAALPTVGTIPKPNLGLLDGDISNAIANAQRGITMEGPKSFGTTVGETIGGLFPKIDSTVAAIPETGALGTATTPRIGYSPTEARANPLTPERFESLRQVFIEPDYEINPRYPTTPSVATQLAPESRGALPTTFAEAPTIRPIDLGSNLDSSSLAAITEQARAVDQNLSRLNEPQVQAQVKTFVENTYAEFAQETPSAFTAKSLGDIYGIGGTSQDVVDATRSVVNNPAAPPEVILEQVDKATEDLKNLDEQLPAKLAMLSNASKLGITPAEAIKLGLLNNNGTKTELGEKVLPEPQPQPRPQPRPQPKPYPDPVAPLTPVKPVLPVKPPLPPTPPPPTVYPPPPIINPPIDSPPIDVIPPIDVEPPIDINPPIINPPPLVQAAITPPKAAPKLSAPGAAMAPSYMYAGAQGSGPGALPGNLQSTFLQGVNVNEYNPFENYNVYQQLGSPAPIRAAEGGSPLQLAQMQQGISGLDPRLYGVLQKRQAPNYFTYGSDTSGGNPTTFAGSQLMGKPTPGIPVIPTGQKAGSDWLYQGSGTNPLAMAGTGIATLPTGTMAEGGQAHGGEGEHIPEFITGATGHYVRGRGDGQSDDIPAMLADGEYVFDASTVSTLGNGSSDAGAKLLDAFRESLRDHTRSAPADKIPPKASPLEYMKEALQNVRRK